MAEPTPRVIAMRIVNGFAEVGTPPTHDEVQSVARALISTQAELDALRRALEEIALHEVRENEPTPCDWHCTATIVATARAALAEEETSGG